ncbi:MAG: cache domain-containing protein, partial [Bacillota bacterium]
MKLSVRIPLFVIAMLAIAVLIIAGLSIIENLSYNEKVSYERVESSASDVNKQIQQMLEHSAKNAVSISQNYHLIQALSDQSFNGMKSALDELNKYLKADTISITDVEGKVLIRQHEPAKLGDSILKQANVVKALAGEVLTTLEPGALVKLSCRTGAPIRHESGAIIGTVVTGYTFENTDILDELKALHNTELTIYAGNEAISTTILENGQRMVGAQLDDKIAKTVLEDGQAYTGDVNILGQSYIAKYSPLLDSTGKVVGAVFVGLSKESIVNATKGTVIHMLIAALLLLAVNALITLNVVRKNIKQPMDKLTEVSQLLAQGRLDVDIDMSDSGKKNEVGILTDAMYEMASQIRAYISDISAVLSSMSNNDFTVKSSVAYIGDYQAIGTALHGISDSLNQTFLLINTAAEQVSSGAAQVSSGAQELAAGSTEQAASVQQLSASISHVSEQAEENAAQVQKATVQLGEAGDRLHEGNAHMTQLIAAMSDISSSSNQIANITKVIEDIAFQTN